MDSSARRGRIRAGTTPLGTGPSAQTGRHAGDGRREAIEAFRRNPDAELGLQLGRLREARHLTQRDVAARWGVTQSKVAHLEAGRRSLTVKDALEIALDFGVSLEDLLPEGLRLLPSTGRIGDADG